MISKITPIFFLLSVMLYPATKKAYNDSMKRLTDTIHDFKEIREHNVIYVDKTEQIFSMIEEGVFYLYLRPPGFGKSILVTTLREIFYGNKALFEGLFIYDKIDWIRRPVIFLDMKALYNENPADFDESLKNALYRIARNYTLDITGDTPHDLLHGLIKGLHDVGEPCATVLVDNYDAPITALLDDEDAAMEMREKIIDLFSVLESWQHYLHFVMLTGVSNLGMASIFPGLNVLMDISDYALYPGLTGFDHDELITYYMGYIKKLAASEDLLERVVINKIKRWYFGYSRDGKNKFYNPASLLKLFAKNRFINYPFNLDVPQYLITAIKESLPDLSALDTIPADNLIFTSHDSGIEGVASMLLQAGYLTVSEMVGDEFSDLYRLTFPNLEVKERLLVRLLADYLQEDIGYIHPLYLDLKDNLEELDTEEFCHIVKTMVSKIAVPDTGMNDAYYRSVFYCILGLLDGKIKDTPPYKNGICAVLTLVDKIIITVFSHGPCQSAMEYLKAQNYHQEYNIQGKKVILFALGGFTDKNVEYTMEVVQ